MLTKLKIQNLILVEEAEIAFGSRLNIMTGETGAGKSAILAAIHLIAGERSDLQMIRKGASFAAVEATLTTLSASVLEEEEIPLPSFPVTVRREIYTSGKSRCFLDGSQITLSSLKKCVGSLLERIGQGSSGALCDESEQRSCLDAFACLKADAAECALRYTQQLQEERQLQSLLEMKEKSDRELTVAEENLQEIESAAWFRGEEEKLSEEHHILSHAQELLDKLGPVVQILSESQGLKRAFSTLCQCAKFDPKINDWAERVHSASLELDDVAHSLHSFLDRLEMDPARLEWVEKRLKTIETVKRRFGASYEEVEKKKKELQEKIDSLSSLDEQLIKAKDSLKSISETVRLLFLNLSQKRKEAADLFAKFVQEELRSLNIPHAEFRIEISPKSLSVNGIDKIRYLFSANPGLPPVPLENSASGGELSRLLFAIKTVLGSKEERNCLVLDEIDSNVGGQTAAILGEKLKKLSEHKQVICVTHFVQVAKVAFHHFRVNKIEHEGRAYTTIAELSTPDRETEYTRMLGK